VSGKAILIGNSDGIGLATTRELLKRGWKAVGISRSQSPIEDPSYEHIVAEVQSDKYSVKLKSVVEKHEPVDLCIFCAGIDEMLDFSDMEGEVKTIEVNLLGMVKTASCEELEI
jgi:NAD(P)-dependent dehydrogenase (short-subunit alcohol dehydrogenase family)